MKKYSRVITLSLFSVFIITCNCADAVLPESVQTSLSELKQPQPPKLDGEAARPRLKGQLPKEEDNMDGEKVEEEQRPKAVDNMDGEKRWSESEVNIGKPDASGKSDLPDNIEAIETLLRGMHFEGAGTETYPDRDELPDDIEIPEKTKPRYSHQLPDTIKMLDQDQPRDTSFIHQTGSESSSASPQPHLKNKNEIGTLDKTGQFDSVRRRKSDSAKLDAPAPSNTGSSSPSGYSSGRPLENPSNPRSAPQRPQDAPPALQGQHLQSDPQHDPSSPLQKTQHAGPSLPSKNINNEVPSPGLRSSSPQGAPSDRYGP